MNWVSDAIDKADQKILSESDLVYEAKGFDHEEKCPTQLKIYYWKPQKSWLAKTISQYEDGESQRDFSDERISLLIPQVFEFEGFRHNFTIQSDHSYSQIIYSSLYHQFSYDAGEPLEQHLFDTRRSEVTWCLEQGYIEPPYTDAMLLDLADCIKEMRRKMNEDVCQPNFFRFLR